MKCNMRLTIEYDGTRFYGWQRQNTVKTYRTAQEELEKAARKLFGKKVSVIGASRTDSGVHAEAQVANFKVESKLPLHNVKRGLNSYLPKDIAIISAEEAGPDFHARFSAREKLYRYTIINRKERSPLKRRFAVLVSYDLDLTAMKKAAKYLIGTKDFKSFQASNTKTKDSVRSVKKIDIIANPPTLEIYIQADGFLYNMVRNIVGTLVDVGRGRTAPEAVREILSKRHRPAAGQTAPAKGLCLVKVFY